MQHAPILYAHNISSRAFGNNGDEDNTENSDASSDYSISRNFEHPTNQYLNDQTFDCTVTKVLDNNPTIANTYRLENTTLGFKSEPFTNEQLETFLTENLLQKISNTTFNCKVDVTCKNDTYELENESLNLRSKLFTEEQLEQIIDKKHLTYATWWT